MKNKLNIKRVAIPVLVMLKRYKSALKNRKPYNINFDGKKIFSPLKDKIVRKIKKDE